MCAQIFENEQQKNNCILFLLRNMYSCLAATCEMKADSKPKWWNTLKGWLHMPPNFCSKFRRLILHRFHVNLQRPACWFFLSSYLFGMPGLIDWNSRFKFDHLYPVSMSIINSNLKMFLHILRKSTMVYWLKKFAFGDQTHHCVPTLPNALNKQSCLSEQIARVTQSTL